MKAEDRLRDAHMATQHNIRHGGQPVLAEQNSRDDEMGDTIVLGDMTTNHPPQKKGMSGLAKAALIAAGMAMAGGLGAFAVDRMFPVAEKVIETITTPGKTITKTQDVDVNVEYVPPK